MSLLKMTIPDYQTLMLPVLEFAAHGEASIKECIAALGNRLGLAEDERSELLPSGRQTVFANRVHWAKTYLTQAGNWRSRGVATSKQHSAGCGFWRSSLREWTTS